MAAAAHAAVVLKMPHGLVGEDGGLRGALQEVAAGGVHLLDDAVRVLGAVVDVGLVVRESFTNFVWSW